MIGPDIPAPYTLEVDARTNLPTPYSRHTLQQGEGAHDVGLVVGPGSLDAAPDAGQGREVDDRRHGAAPIVTPEHGPQRSRLRDVESPEGEAGTVE